MKSPRSEGCEGWPEDIRNLHFIGIGGVGMSGIAQLYLDRGYTVSGSDMNGGPTVDRLRARGATIHKGHRASNVPDDCDLVVYSSAIAPSNPEMVQARKAGLPARRRAEALGWLMKDGQGIAVAGAHGKTTTTSMAGWILEKGGLDPTLIVGGQAHNVRGNVRIGKGAPIVVEADESDGSFLLLPVHTAIVTNIDNDHMDHYRDMDHLIDSFRRFIDGVAENGSAVVCLDDPILRELLPSVSARTVTYGLEPGARYRAEEIEFSGGETRFRLVVDGRDRGEFRLSVPGRHNLQNALGAMAMALELGVGEEAIREALGSFAGVERRYQFIGECQGIKIFDDYAHHPTEIRATLQSIRLSTPRRLVAVFQPHRFSRTEMLAPSFGTAFRDADLVYLLPIYAAGEKPRRGVTSDLIYRHMVEHTPYTIHVTSRAKMGETIALLASQLEEGDTVVTIGAGDVNKLGRDLLAYLESSES